MTRCVTGGGDEFETRHRLGEANSLDKDFRVRLSALVFLMNEPLAPKFFSIFGPSATSSWWVRNIYRMPPMSLKLTNQMGQELGGVDEPVAFRVLDEVTIAAKGFGGIKATIKDFLFNGQGKITHDLRGMVGMKVPMEPVGQARRAWVAARVSSGVWGWDWTKEVFPASSKILGAN